MAVAQARLDAMKVGFLAGYNQAIIELMEMLGDRNAPHLSEDDLIAFADASIKGADQESWDKLKADVIDRLFG